MVKKLSLVITILILIISFSGCVNKTQSTSDIVGNVTVSNTENENASDTIVDETDEKEAEEEKEVKQPTDEGNKNIISIKYESEAIKSNMIEDENVQDIYIYLPPSYFVTEKYYPVVYFLHGHSETPGYFLVINKSVIDETMQLEENKEFIIVEVDGYNKYGGSFYVNSPVIGNWEDYVINEIIPYIDENYRTLKDSASRGIAGFSMGGFGAVNLAFLHPDVFAATYAVSPGLFDENGLENAMRTWTSDTRFITGYGEAFSPNIEGEDPYSNTPQFDGTEEDNIIIQDWENGYGNLEQKIENYQALGIPLKAVAIKYGVYDGYGWIPEGCIYLSNLLSEKGIDNHIESYNGGHQLPSMFIQNDFTPFFTENLKFE